MDHQIEEKLTFSEQFRNFLATNATLLLAAGVALLLISDVFGTHGVLAMRHSQKQAAGIQKQIDTLNQANQKLENKIKSLKSDPTAVEHIAREQMRLARPGEYIFEVPTKQVDDSDDPQDTPGKP